MSTKHCTKCGETKNVEEFTKSHKTNDGLYYCCKSCKNLNRKYIPECPKKAKARRKRFYDNNPGYWNERNNAWAKANPEKIRAKRRRQTASGLDKIHTQQRRAKIRNLPNSFGKKDWLHVLYHFNNSCAYCGRHSDKLQMEHFIPLSKNGHFTTYNIIPACASCNLSKTNLDCFVWYPQQAYFCVQKLENILSWLNYHALRNGVKLSESMRDGAKYTEVLK